MSETLEQRLRNRVAADPNAMVSAYASDLLEYIDELREENGKITKLAKKLWLAYKEDAETHDDFYDELCAEAKEALKEFAS